MAEFEHWSFHQLPDGWQARHDNGQVIDLTFPARDAAVEFVEAIGGDLATPTKRLRTECGKGHRLAGANVVFRKAGGTRIKRVCLLCEAGYRSVKRRRRGADQRKRRRQWYDWVVVERIVTDAAPGPGRKPTLAEAEAVVARTWDLAGPELARRAGVATTTVHDWRKRWPQPVAA